MKSTPTQKEELLKIKEETYERLKPYLTLQGKVIAQCTLAHEIMFERLKLLSKKKKKSDKSDLSTA